MSCHTHNSLFNIDNIKAKCKEVIQSDRIINRRQVEHNSLNEQQKNAHDIIVRALNLNENQSKTDSGNNISRL